MATNGFSFVSVAAQVPAVVKPKTEKKKAVDTKAAKSSIQDDRLTDPLAEKLRQQR